MPSPPDRTPGEGLPEKLSRRGITDPKVLDAIRDVPRARFLLPEEQALAGEDRALPIDCEQTISQPYMVGLMTQELALTGAERVLEIGTGSGYQCAILARLAKEVFTVERHLKLSLRARALLDGLGYANVHYRVGDGTLGWPEHAPFDRVLVTAGVPALPPALFDQLAEGGLIVVPLGPEEQQQLCTIRKESGRQVVREVIPCRFVRLIGEGGWGD